MVTSIVSFAHRRWKLRVLTVGRGRRWCIMVSFISISSHSLWDWLDTFPLRLADLTRWPRQLFLGSLRTSQSLVLGGNGLSVTCWLGEGERSVDHATFCLLELVDTTYLVTRTTGYLFNFSPTLFLVQSYRLYMVEAFGAILSVPGLRAASRNILYRLPCRPSWIQLN